MKTIIILVDIVIAVGMLVATVAMLTFAGVIEGQCVTHAAVPALVAVVTVRFALVLSLLFRVILARSYCYVIPFLCLV